LSLSNLLESITRRSIPIDFNKLLSAAVRRTGLKDYCDPQCEESLKVLIDSCNNEAGLSLIGRIAVRQHLLELLETRFRLLDYWQRTPEIMGQQIRPQIIITGTPKSATTFLHRLLSHDRTNRIPLMWEVMFPLPSPVHVPLESDPRIRKADKRLRWLKWAHPELAKAHPVGPFIPQECGAILGYTFKSNVFLDMFSIPSYENWLRIQDMDSVYKFHLMFLKHLQWQCPAERWVLKSSDHVHALETLIEVYPEAHIVFLHRDPLKVLQAACSQMTLLRSVFSRRLDLRKLGEYETRSLNDKVKKIMEFRRNHVHLEDQFMDIRYLDLAADPMGTVRAIYDRVGLYLSPENEARMRSFANAKRKKQRPDTFSLADFSLGHEQESLTFGLYCERFNVVREAL